MNEDTKFAVRFMAEEYGIDKEDSIEKLFKLFEDNKYNNIDELLDETFDINMQFHNDFIEYSNDSDTHKSNINELHTYMNIVSEGLLNSRLQNQTRLQLNGNNQVNLPPNNFIQPFFQHHNPFINIFSNLQQMNINPYEPVRVCLKKESLNKIKDMTYDEIKENLPNLDANEKCAICWDKLSDQSEEFKYYKILPCSHAFHSICISEELSNYSYHCPICKKECGEHEAILDEDNDNSSDGTYDDMPGLIDNSEHDYIIDDSTDNEGE